MPKKKIVNEDGQDSGSGKVGFPEKWLKKINHWVETADSMSDEELKKAIVDSEGNIYTIDNEKDEDVKLNGAKELVKDMSEPYRDAKAVQTAKIKYALYLLESRGLDLNNTESEKD
jgi:hypothetical protein